MPIARVSGSLATSWAILPSNFRTGSKTVARNGVSRSWIRLREGVMTLLVRTLSTLRTMRWWSFSKPGKPARIMIAIGAEDRWHLQLAQRWIVQYNFYINDLNWGRMFVRICPYPPFSGAFVSINTAGWLI